MVLFRKSIFIEYDITALVAEGSSANQHTDSPNESRAYDVAYGRMMQMYAAGYVHATDAVEVAQVIQLAIETDDPKLRYPVSWGGPGITEGRAKMTDEQWVALGRLDSMEDYIAAFEQYFGIDITA